MQMMPLGNRVVLRVVAAQEKIGSLYVPDSAMPQGQTALVLAVGFDVERVAIGDEVLFPKYAGTEVELAGDKYLVLHEDELLGKVVPEDN